MAKTVVLHIMGEDPILADIDQDPQPTDLYVKVSNLRKRDGKEVIVPDLGRAECDLPLAPNHLSGDHGQRRRARLGDRLLPYLSHSHGSTHSGVLAIAKPALLTFQTSLVRMSHESGCGPVAVLVFKTSGRGDELRRWVRLPRALVTNFTGLLCDFQHNCRKTIAVDLSNVPVQV